jgi:pimeloyl-ACP methyl ester carboxylesterase
MRVLYLHGFASGPASYKAQLFGKRLALETPDLAAGDFEGLTITRQLAVVERAAGGEPVALIGSSMGGYLAALYAARHPEAARLVLMAPAFGFGRLWAESLGPARMEEWRRDGRLPVYHYAEGREAHVGYELYEDALRYEEMPAVAQPALVFHGVHDSVVPPAVSVEFARQNPSASLRLVDSDHELRSAVEEIWPEVERFLL